MSTPLKLEVFETAAEPECPVVMMPDEIEDIRLNAYERGYVAGWDDNARQEEADESTRRAAIERQIEQLTFSYHDARGHVLKAIEPLLTAMLHTVLPAASRAALVPHVLEQLLPMAHAASETPLVLEVRTGSRDAFLEAFEGQPLPPLSVVETEDLPEFAARFSSGASQTQIDLSQVAEALDLAIRNFYQIQEEEARHA